MEVRTLLIALVLQSSLVALGGAAERCAQPGALRCEDGRHQSVCLERSLVWHRVRDCAASGGFCADGRCVGDFGGRAARKTCTFEEDESKCTEDCTGIEMCLFNNVISTVKCPNGKLCDDTNGAECVAASDAECSKTFQCTVAATLPDITNPSTYYECKESGESAVKVLCGIDEGYFNACEGSCDAKLLFDHDYGDCSTVGYSFAIVANPSIYAICMGDYIYWNKCQEGYYDIQAGECVGSTIYCSRDDED